MSYEKTHSDRFVSLGSCCNYTCDEGHTHVRLLFQGGKDPCRNCFCEWVELDGYEFALMQFQGTSTHTAVTVPRIIVGAVVPDGVDQTEAEEYLSKIYGREVSLTEDGVFKVESRIMSSAAARIHRCGTHIQAYAETRRA